LDEDSGEGGGLGDVKWLPDHEIVLVSHPSVKTRLLYILQAIFAT